MARISVFIDGFNVYHALNDSWDNIKKCKKYRNLLWLNYRTFAEQFINADDHLKNVFYFTAFANWRPSSVIKHKIYVEALKHHNVEIVLGNFKEKPRYCNQCKQSFITHEEKQTDVNISIYLLREAVLDNYDKAIIFGADSDLIPAIKTVKQLYPNKQIGVIIPIERERYSKEIRTECDFYRYTKKKHYERSQLTYQIHLPKGKVLTKPADWQ